MNSDTAKTLNLASCSSCGVFGLGVVLRDTLCRSCLRSKERFGETKGDRNQRVALVKKAMDKAERKALDKAFAEDPKRAGRIIERKWKEMKEKDDIADGGLIDSDLTNYDSNNDHIKREIANGFNVDGISSNIAHIQDSVPSSSHDASTSSDSSSKSSQSSLRSRLSQIKAQLNNARKTVRDSVRDEERRNVEGGDDSQQQTANKKSWKSKNTAGDPNAFAVKFDKRKNDADGDGDAGFDVDHFATDATAGPTVLDCDKISRSAKARAERVELAKTAREFHLYNRDASKIASIHDSQSQSEPPSQSSQRQSGAGNKSHTDPTEIYKKLNAEGGRRKTPGGIETMSALVMAKQRAAERAKKRREEKRSSAQDHVNARNAQYNAKLEKAYGEYAADTKDALERGTAL